MCTKNAFLGACVHQLGAQIYESKHSLKFLAAQALGQWRGCTKRIFLLVKNVHPAVHKTPGMECQKIHHSLRLPIINYQQRLHIF